MALDDKTLEVIPSWVCIFFDTATPDELIRVAKGEESVSYSHPRIGLITITSENMLIDDREKGKYGYNSAVFRVFQAGFNGEQREYKKYEEQELYIAGEKARRGTVWKWRKLERI